MIKEARHHWNSCLYLSRGADGARPNRPHHQRYRARHPQVQVHPQIQVQVPLTQNIIHKHRWTIIAIDVHLGGGPDLDGQSSGLEGLLEIQIILHKAVEEVHWNKVLAGVDEPYDGAVDNLGG